MTLSQAHISLGPFFHNLRNGNKDYAHHLGQLGKYDDQMPTEELAWYVEPIHGLC